MKPSLKFSLLVILSVGAVFEREAWAQEFPAGLLKSVPQVEEKLNSADVNRRISVLQEIVDQKKSLEIPRYFLPLKLERADYAFVVRKILEKDLLEIDVKSAPDAFERLRFLIESQRLKEFSKPLADYLVRSEKSALTADVKAENQSQILYLLRGFNAVESDRQIAVLLGSSNKYVREQALSTLIALESKKAMPVLLELLKDKPTRYSAIENLVRIKAVEAAPEIAERLADEDFNVRYMALRALVALRAGGHNLKIWNLYASEEDAQIKNYAFAALVLFDDDKAIQLIPQLLSSDIVNGTGILALVGDMKARAAVPLLIATLDKGKFSDDFYVNIAARRAMVNCLGNLNAKEAIPVLRKYVRTEKHFPKWEAIRVLGEFGAREAVDDLMFVLDEALAKFDGYVQSDAYHTVNNASQALAALGDPKAWSLLIKTAAHPKFLYGSQIIGELNRHLDPLLWARAEKQKLSEPMINQSIRFITYSINRERGVELVLEFEPGKDFARRAPLENSDGYPWAYVGKGQSVLEVARSLPRAISDGTEISNFTFVFDDGKIRILSLEKAVRWWQAKLSVK